MNEFDIEIYAGRFKSNVADFILSIQNTEFDIPITLELQPDLLDIPGFYQVNNGNFWVATRDDEIVGTISLLDIGNRTGALRKMFVHKDHRGKVQGVSRQLLNTLLEWARQKGFLNIYLGTTEKFTRAQRFYEKNGFAEIRKEELPETFPVMEVDSRFYRLSFL